MPTRRGKKNLNTATRQAVVAERVKGATIPAIAAKLGICWGTVLKVIHEPDGQALIQQLKQRQSARWDIVYAQIIETLAADLDAAETWEQREKVRAEMIRILQAGDVVAQPAQPSWPGLQLPAGQSVNVDVLAARIGLGAAPALPAPVDTEAIEP